MSADANFHLIGLKKRNNQDEGALWDGRGYIRRQEDLDKHVQMYQGGLQEEVSSCRSTKLCINPNEQKSTCSNFQAMDRANTLKHRGQNVSGLAMILCRHELAEPEGAVNLQLGER